MVLERGCQVHTVFGGGQVDEVGETLVVLLDWRALLYSPTHTVSSSAVIIESSFCDVGSCLSTRYGPGVLLRWTGEVHVVRLWGPWGRGSATAFMPKRDIIKKIKGLPGLTVETLFGSGLLEHYDKQKEMYTVQLPFGVAHLHGSAITSCLEAKVLPTTEYLADMTLNSISLRQVCTSIADSGAVASIMEPLGSMFNKLDDGQLSSMDEMLSLRSKQLSEHIMNLDVHTFHKSIQEKIDDIATDSGKIEMLLEEGKQRILAMMESADKRDELVSSTKSSIYEYLSAGKDQIDSVLHRIKESSTCEEKEALKNLHSVSKDVGTSLSVIRNLASSDPVLQELMSKVYDTNNSIASKAKEFGASLHETEAIQVLEEGSKNLTQRLSNILDSYSSDVHEVKDMGNSFIQALEKQGARDKGYALIDGVKSRVISTLRSNHSDESILSTKYVSNSIEEKLVSMLDAWKGNSVSSEKALESQLSRITALLSMAGEGGLSLQCSLNMPNHQLSSYVGSDFARKQLNLALKSILESSEDMSGYAFFKQFYLQQSVGDVGIQALYSASVFQDSWQGAIAESSKRIKSVVESVDSPLLKDVASPLGRIIDQISSGQFNVDEAIQAAKESLSSGQLSASARDIIAKGDQVVTMLEQFREHDAVRDLLDRLKDMNIEEKASFLSNFDPDSLLNDVEQSISKLTGSDASVSSQESRNKLLNSTKDKLMGFLLEHIPNMAIPDIQGVKDDVQFAIRRLDLSGFKLKKEDVQVTLGNSLKEEFLVCEASNIAAAFKGVKWKYQQLYFPYLSGNGTAEASVLDASIRIGFKIIRVPKGTVRVIQNCSDLSGVFEGMEHDAGQSDPSAHVIYERFPCIKHGVEAQRRENMVVGGLPRGKNSSSGSLSEISTGSSDSNASIWGDEGLEWEPALIMSSQSIHIDHLSLRIDDSSLSWLYNLLASVFEGIIRDYVCKSLKDMLSSRCSLLLGMINSTAANYWPVIRNILQVDIVSLRDAKMKDMAMLLGPPRLPAGDGSELEITPREYTLKLSESGPLGFKLEFFDSNVSVAAAGGRLKNATRVVVTGAVEGSQAEKALASSGVQDFIDGACIVSVNGKAFKNLSEKEALQCLKGARPLYVTIKLSMDAWERLGVHRSMLAKQRSAQPSSSLGSSGNKPANMRKLAVAKVEFQDGPLGLKLKETRSCGGAIIITGFSRTKDDEMLQAERTGRLRIGMVMLSVGGEVVFGRPFDDVMQVIKSAKRPVQMMFVPSPDKQITFHSPPSDLLLGRIEGYVMVAAFSSPSPSGEHKGIYPGMVILQVNKEPIGSGMTPEDVQDLIHRPFKQSNGEPSPKTKIAVRDMDSFMHLIRIRDGEQSIEENNTQEYIPQDD